MPTVSPRPRPEAWAEYKLRYATRWTKPFFFLEWLWETLAYWLSCWAFLEVLEYAGKLSVLFAVFYYIYEAPDRTKLKHYQAWQVINTAEGKGGSGGRLDALQELNHEHVQLVGVNAAGAFLMGIRLERANLLRANFEAADMRGASLRSANLESASMHAVNLRAVDLQDALLNDADLTGADMEDANLSNARLSGADLSGADLRNCNLAGADWKGIAAIKSANIIHLQNAPEGFLSWALQQGAVAIESQQEWIRATNKP